MVRRFLLDRIDMSGHHAPISEQLKLAIFVRLDPAKSGFSRTDGTASCTRMALNGSVSSCARRKRGGQH